MFDYLPKAGANCPHRTRDYFIAGFTFFCVGVSLVIDGSASLETQNQLGVIAWVFLIGLLVGENKEVRMQVVIAVAFASAGEYFASIYMEGYTYRFENVPLYVPPGHGMVYLTAVALARSRFFLMNAKSLAMLVIVTGGLWSLWGISGIPEQGDQVGAFLFVIFVCYAFYIMKRKQVEEIPKHWHDILIKLAKKRGRKDFSNFLKSSSSLLKKNVLYI